MLLSKGTPAIGLAMMCLAPLTNAFQSALHACPAPCDGDSGDWTVYSSVNRLRSCPEPMLLDMSLYTDLESANGISKLFVCTPNNTNSVTSTTTSSPTGEPSAQSHHGISHKRFHHRDTASSCILGEQQTISMELNKDPAASSTSGNDLKAILKHTQDHFVDIAHCDTTNLFGYYNKAAVGVYFGSAIDNVKSISSVLDHLHEKISDAQDVKSMVLQHCNDVPNADYIIGVAVDTTGDLASVQKSVASWHTGQCAHTAGASTTIEGVPILEKPLGSPLSSNNTIDDQHLSKRGDCKTVSVIGGDTCGSLAEKCGISTIQFNKYNTDKDLCSTLFAGDRVCCSAGTLPDITPKQNKDGSCVSYKIKGNDHCKTIAASHGLKASDISNFNDGTTWGWFGCNDLQIGSYICLSKGDPPMPASVSNAQCGPLVPGTKRPTNGTALSDLNQCPLNSCCDIWGQCGITPEYCTNVTGTTGNPGTAPKDKNGCISNCGTKIEKSNYPPADQYRVGYYESWNFDRPCLNLRAGHIDVTDYTHVHWGFASITDDFNVTINDTYKQWDSFTNLLQVKKIVSFGGWGYSTSPSTYDKLREAMDPKNMDTFIDNIFNFVEANGLDGVDFDWEYPGAQDIPGIPKGLSTDGTNYLNFLKKMKLNFDMFKTVSIAAPASYWYLKNFPIGEMSKTLDYIVYMTYDLHGQWDYGKAWTQDGCPDGNCLRSQVNLTETEYALAMITKAGVDSTKVMVGVPSYGRSFGMASADCTGPSCHYTGTKDHSTAQEGECTKTAGIIAQAEINRILNLDEQDKTWYDQGSGSNIIVWNNTWAAFMDGDTLSSRKSYYESYNFGGTIDWAIDLKMFTGDDGNPSGQWEDPPVPTLSACTETFDSLEALDDAAGSIPEHCTTQYVVQTLSDLLGDAMSNYTDLMNDGYDAKFKIYADSVASNAGSSVHDYVYENGNKYFTCKVDEYLMCCAACTSDAYNCDLCSKTMKCERTCDSLGCESSHSMGERIPNREWETISEPCPPDYSERFIKDDDNNESVHWTLEDDKADQFWADLYTNTGVNKSYVEFGTYTREQNCNGDVKSDDDCWKTGYDFNIPKATGYNADDVDNPKDTAKKGLARSGNMHPQIKDLLLEMNTDSFLGSGADVIDSISVPILMIVSAVQEMSKVETIADKISAEEKKMKEEEIIGGFIAAILFLVPVAGEVLGTVEGLADMATVLSIAGTAADVGLSVADIVKHPNNAALDIMNIVFDAGALTSLSKVSKAAKLRREMEEADVAKLGTKVSDGLKTIERVTGKCVS